MWSAKRNVVVAAAVLVVTITGVAQEPLSDADMAVSIDQLGDFDYEVRTRASSLLRRVPADQVQPALAAAAAGHEDGYVRYRALVLLIGFGGKPARDAVFNLLGDPNDRLRAVAYGYLAHEPELTMVPVLLGALETETSEFVRPALIRALAAHAADPAVRERLIQDIDRGVDFFRGAVIESLGDQRAEYAVEPLMRIVAEAGPLRDDAILALTRIGDAEALPVLAALQGIDPELEPLISAAAVSFGVDRQEHMRFVSDTLRYAVDAESDTSSGIDRFDLLTSAASGLGALASTGDGAALATLFDAAIGARNAERERIALVLGTLAMRDPPLLLSFLETRSDFEEAALVIRDGFDMLDEDLEEERFFITVRTKYWDVPADSAARVLTDRLIAVLEF